MPALLDMTGQQIGRLTILRRGENIGGKPGWVCRCECGIVKTYRGGDLRLAKVLSCGCLRNDRVRAVITTHGHKPRSGQSTEYGSWVSMRDRCSNSNRPDFKYYGGRGISVCQRWQDSFEAFLEDMGRKPSAKHSLDRIDNNGNYEPSNCRWATWSEQRRNTRDYIARHGAEQ